MRQNVYFLFAEFNHEVSVTDGSSHAAAFIRKRFAAFNQKRNLNKSKSRRNVELVACPSETVERSAAYVTGTFSFVCNSG